MVLDITSMRCFRDPSAECLLHKIKHDHQWKWIDLVMEHSILHKRFHFVCSRNRTHWYAVLLHKDKYEKVMEISERKLRCCGIIVAKGTEECPPQGVVSMLCLYSPLNFDPNDLHTLLQ